MKAKKKKWAPVVLIAAIALLCAAVYFSNPQLRVKTFVSLHKQKLEQGIEANLGVPANIGVDVFNTWSGEHSMTEFILFTWGDTYYGCYYSPDDVPLAFQNTKVKLTQDGHAYWTWKAGGDNHGATSKIADRWYYFEASF